MELDAVLSKVRGLINKAESLEQAGDTNSMNEASACRAAADKMMLKHAIDQQTLRDSQPVAERVKPGKITIDICPVGSPYESLLVTLVGVICEHTRTSAVFLRCSLKDEGIIAYYQVQGRQASADVYGFEGDLRYFELLFTILHLHLSRGIDPKINDSLSDEENAYNLHLAGLNWGEIAKMYLPRGHQWGWDGHKVLPPEVYPGQYWKKCYARYCKRTGAKSVSLPPKFTESARFVYRMNFGRSYAATMRQRFWRARNERPQGAELVLKSSMDEIQAAIKADFGDGLANLEAAREVPYSEVAWAAGSAHAKSADLNTSSRMGDSERLAL